MISHVLKNILKWSFVLWYRILQYAYFHEFDGNYGTWFCSRVNELYTCIHVYAHMYNILVVEYAPSEKSSGTCIDKDFPGICVLWCSISVSLELILLIFVVPSIKNFFKIFMFFGVPYLILNFSYFWFCCIYHNRVKMKKLMILWSLLNK